MLNRESLIRVLDRSVAWGLWIVLFLAPLKWGLPILEPDKAPFPRGFAEWLIGSWPLEVFCFAVYFLFFLHCLHLLLNDKILVSGPRLYWLGPILFLIASVVSSHFSVHASLSLSYDLVYCAYVLLFFLILWRQDAHDFLLRGVIASSGVVALYAIFQRFEGFAQTAQWAHLYSAGNPQLDMMNAKLNSGRVFASFVYPNSLGGYIVMTLPLTILWLWGVISKRSSLKFWGPTVLLILAGSAVYLGTNMVDPLTLSGTRWVSMLLLGAIALPATQLVALFLTQSQGSLLTLAIIGLGIGMICIHTRCKGPAKIAFLLLMLAGVLTLFVFLPFKWDTLLMRCTYWVAAVKMGFSRLLLGFGPGSFGNVYPRFKLDWGGETQLAHSHALQIFAESGIFAAFAWLFWWIGWAFPGKFKNMPKGALIGVTGFLLHGLMDFDFFIPGITIQAIFLLAVLWASISVPVQRTLRLSAIGRWSYAFILAIVLVILPYRYFQRSALGMGYFSQGLALAEQADWIEARKSLDQAVSCQPNLPSYHFYRGLILEREGDREGALQSYRQASTLAPSVAYYYYRVGLLTSASNPFAALSALREAQRNNPGNPEYALAIKKLEKLNGQGLGALIK